MSDQFYSYLAEKILDYNVFTDIEFNHKKSINCQARAAAIFVSLSKRGIMDEFINNRFKINRVYKVTNGSVELMSVPSADID